MNKNILPLLFTLLLSVVGCNPMTKGTISITASVNIRDPQNVSNTSSSVPTSFATTVTTGSAINLSWAASTGTGAITYKVYRSITSGTGYSVLAACDGISALTCIDSTVTPNTPYYYVVTSLNAVGESIYSSQVLATPMAAFALSSLAQSGLTQVTLNWGTSSGATLYTVKYGTVSGTYGITAGTSVSTSLDIQSLTTGITYYFTVIASNSSGTVSASAPLSFTVNSNPNLSLNLLNTLIPTIGSVNPSFTRSTIATITDFEGVVRTTKINEARFSGARRVENLLSPSVYNGDIKWSALSSAVLVQNAAIAPDGTNTAASMDFAADTVSGRVAFDTSAFYNTKINMGYTMSVYLKSATVAGVWNLRYRDGDGIYTIVPVNIDTTWKRYSFYIPPKTGVAALVFYTGQAGAGALTKAYFWGAQIEEVPQTQTVKTASEYISCGVNTSPPFNGAGVDCVKYFSTLNGNSATANLLTEATGSAISSTINVGYLSEANISNFVTYSDQFDTGGYLKTRSSITPNVAISPDGLTNADKLVEDTSTGNHEFVRGFTTSPVAGTTYTASIYVKPTTPIQRRYFRVQFDNAAFPGSGVSVYDLQAGTVTNTGALVTASIKALPNGWFRISHTVTATVSAPSTFYITLTSDATGSTAATAYTGDGASGTYFWGIQLEANYFASSYIPTAGASLQRDNDYLTYATAGIFDSTNDYSLAGEAKLNAIADTSANWQCLISSSSTYQPFLRMANGPNSSAAIFFSNAGVGNAYYAPQGDASKFLFHKFAARRSSATGLDVYFDGTRGLSGTLGTQLVNPTQLLIGNRSTSFPQGLNGNIKSIKIWPYPLTDTDFAGL